MNLHLISFGKLKTPGLRDTADHYLKKMGGWHRVEETELKPVPVPDKSESTRLKVQTQEARALFQVLDRQKGHLYLLDEKGKARTSLEWASWLQERMEEGSGTAHLCVGSGLGFARSVREKAAGLLSLGPHTLPHELARVVALEQLYRAMSINHGHPYHNEGI